MTTPHIMLDIETLGTTPGCVIASIGACTLDPESGEVARQTFYDLIDIGDAVGAGLTIEYGTVLWWLRQDDAARGMLLAGQDAEPADLLVAMEAFEGFIGKDAELWCNGASFDFAIIGDAYDRFNWPRPWAFYHERDLRTLKGLNKGLRIERNGTHHNALDDAIHQARLVQHILNSNPDMDA